MRKTNKTDQPVLFKGNTGVTSELRRRWLLNAGLLLLIAALTWVAMQRSEQKQATPAPPLTAVSTSAISHIRIERPEQPDIALEKTGEEWKLTAPQPARANQFNVEALLGTLSAPGIVRFPAVAGELGKFGLDRPQSRIQYENETIAFGAVHPLNNQVYVLYKNEVVLIPAHHLSAATYPYTNFIDSRLLEADRRLVALRIPGFSLTLKDGVWHRQPPDKKLSSDQINDFTSEWQNARALSVEKYSGKRAIGEIDITTTRESKSEKLRLGILATHPDFVLHRQDENLEYHFTEETGKRLLNLSVNREP
ncbi:MAG: DUF4340 domain-containing protein [Sulfuricaulis sp.]|nr:DUF4340 domain-containing protein [Sulfuricaulis sp.]